LFTDVLKDILFNLKIFIWNIIYRMKMQKRKSNEELVVGIDSSTTSTKVIVLNKSGKVKAQSQKPIPLFSPYPNFYEQNAEDWWKSTREALKIITGMINPGRIKALAISNQRETFVPLDENEKALRPAIIWLDERCKSEVEQFSRKVGKKKIHQITGKPVDYAPVVYRLAWMKNNEVELLKKTYMVCDVHTYLVKKLTGSYKTSWSSADPLGVFDLKNKKWAKTILDALDLTEKQFPEVYCPGAIIGRINKKASKLTGLNENTLVVAGSGDGQAAGLGANSLKSECSYLNLGTAVVAGVYGDKYKASKAFRTMSSCSDKGYYYECSLRAGTFSIDWFIKKILNIDPIKYPGIYTKLQKEANEVPIGSNQLMYVPYLCGVMNPYWDINARGAFIGLSSFHHRGHIYRAILEGIAFEQLFAIEAVEKNIGIKVKNFIVIGGGSTNELWCNIIADITGKNICLPENPEASCLGAGIAAAIGVGWYKTFKKAAFKMTGIKKIIKPDIQNYKKYQQLYKVYKKIYPTLKRI
jgi:xylulokinase